MQQSDFHISLDEFPGLFVVPTVTHPEEPDQGEISELLNEYQEAFRERFPHYTYYEGVPSDTLVLNDLRHRYAYSEDKARSMLFADRTLQIRYKDSYLMNILSGWKLDSNPQQAVHNLLSAAEKYSSLFCLRAACLLKSAQICTEHGLFVETRRLCLAVLAAIGNDRIGAELGAENLPAGQGPHQWRSNEGETHFPRNYRLNPQISQMEFINQHGIRFLSVSEAYRAEALARYFFLGTPWTEERVPEQLKLASSEPAQQTLLQMLIEKHNLSDIQERIVQNAQTEIRFSAAHQKPDRIDGSRFGGLPDVPPNWHWPGPELEFLAQFNLAELAPHDHENLLPKRGLLSFFARNLGYGWSGDAADYHVMFTEGDSSLLQRAPVPANFDVYGEARKRESDLMVFGTVPVEPYPYLSIALPNYDNWESSDDVFVARIAGLNEDLRLQSFICAHNDQLLGRYEDGATEAWSGRNGESYYSLQDAEKAAAERELEEWILLFIVDSNYNIGMSFSDAGTLFFMIHRDDLAARRFDRIHISMTCG